MVDCGKSFLVVPVFYDVVLREGLGEWESGENERGPDEVMGRDELSCMRDKKMKMREQYVAGLHIVYSVHDAPLPACVADFLRVWHGKQWRACDVWSATVVLGLICMEGGG